MSLVEAQDGQYYFKPIWYGVYDEDLKWYLHEPFDLELKVEVLSKHGKNVKKKIISALQEIGFDFKISRPEYAIQPFPPTYSRLKAFSFLFTPLSPFPVPQEHQEFFTVPDYNDLRFCWNIPFRTEDVWSFFQKNGRKLNSILASFVLGKTFVETDSMHVAVRNKIKRQVNLNKIPLEVALEKHGEYIKLKKRCLKMKYLYITHDGDTKQSDSLPKEEDIQNVIDGYGEIYRFENGEFEQFTPIDAEDTDNWSLVERIS